MMAEIIGSPEAGGPQASDGADAFVSYSRNFADILLHRLFAGTSHGFFVDVQPGSPKIGNDLYALYRAGWSGINVEADLAGVAALREYRPRDQTVHATLGEGDGGDGTLTALLAEWAVRTVDVLRIGAGAATEAVLGGNDWDRFRPKALLLVTRDPITGIGLAATIRGFLEQRGYRHAVFDGMNDLYLEQGFEAPADLVLPPNLSDRFVLAETSELRARLTKLSGDLVGSTDLQAALERALDAARVGQDEANDAVQRLAEENRRLAGEARQSDGENRRLRSASDRMQAELTVLNRLLQPLHTLGEQMDRQRRSHEAEQEWWRAETDRLERRAENEGRRRDIDLRATLQRRDREQQVALQQRDMQAELERRQHVIDQQPELQRHDAEIHALRAALASVYGSSSWKLTRAWRFSGRLMRRLRR